MARGRNRFAYNELPPPFPFPHQTSGFGVQLLSDVSRGLQKFWDVFRYFHLMSLHPPNIPPTDAAILNWEVRPQRFSWLFIGCSKYVWGADFFHYGWMAAKPCPCLTTPNHTILYHTIPYHIILYQVIPYHTMLCLTILYHTILCLTKPYHGMPYYIIPYLTMPYNV